MNTKAVKGLLVEDNPGDARLVRELLRDCGTTEVDIVHILRLDEALRCLDEESFNVVLLDLGLPDSQGLDSYTRIRDRVPGVPVVVLSGLDDEALAIEAVRAGAEDYLVKGELVGSVLVRSLGYAIERKQTTEALRRALGEAEDRRAESEALLAGARSVIEYHSFRDAARSIFDRCKKLLGAQAGYVALSSPDGSENEVVFLDSDGHDCTVDPDLPMPIRGLRAEAYRTGNVVYDNDFGNSEWQEFVPGGHAPLESVLLAPLKLKGEVVGLLGLGNKPGGFTDRDARIAAAFGEFASVALQNSRSLESLETSERRFRSVVQTAGDAVITLDVKGDVAFWNQAAEKIFGFSAGEMVGRPLVAIMPERSRKAHQVAVERSAATGLSNLLGNTVELVGLRKDGSEFPLELSLAAWKAGDDQLYTGIVRDISDRKHAEELLRQAHQDLEKRVDERTAEFTEANARLEREIEERRLAEEAVREKARMLDAFFRYSLTSIVFLDRHFNFLRVNEAYARGCQREVSEFPGHNHFEFYPSDAQWIFEDVRETKKPFQVFARPFVFPDHPEWGVTYWDWTLVPILDDAGEVELLVFSLNDVTERKRTEEAHRLDEARLEALVKLNDMAEAPFQDVVDFALEEAAKVTESELGFLGFMNDDESVMAIHSWSGEAMEQCAIADRPSEFPVSEAGLWGEAIRQRKPVVVNDYAASKQWKKGYPKGHVRISRFLAVPVFEGARIVAVAAVANKESDYQEGDARQLTLLMDGMWRLVQRQRAEKAVRESRIFLQTIIDEIPEALMVIDRDYRVALANRVVREMVDGQDPVSDGLPCYHVYHKRNAPCEGDEHPCPVQEVFSTEAPVETTHTHSTPGGEEMLMDVFAAPVFDEGGSVVQVIEVCRDITARVRAEQRVRQHQAELAHATRLGTMGEMASNLAHELSQPLATIVNYVQACLMRVRSGRSGSSDLLADMERVAAQAKLAGDIIHGMRNFLRKGKPQRRVVNINELARDARDLVEFESRSAGVRMRFELDDALPSIMAEAIQIEQVMVNLMRNAIEAVKEGNGADPEIVVRTSNGTEGSVQFAVQDTGPGLSDDADKRLFEPFFTTKPNGMGMGLSISHTIVESHGGHLWAENNQEGGTTFRFTLPVGAGDS